MSTIKNTLRAVAVSTLALSLVGSVSATAHAEHTVTETQVVGEKPSRLADNLQSRFYPKSDIVYLASGQSYPDAIAGGPLFSQTASPLYLTDNWGGAAGDWRRIKTMETKKVVILGGHAAVGKWAEALIEEDAPGTVTERIAGRDRYETAALISQRAFPSGSNTAYLVSGQNFPDALAAGAAAGVNNVPVLLSDPKFIPNAMLAELERMKVANIVIIGGVAAVNDDVFRRLEAEGYAVRRVSGTDRYLTAIEVAKAFFPPTSHVTAASGDSFQAALIASAPAVKLRRPLLLKRTNCTPKSVLQYLNETHVQGVISATVGPVPPGIKTSC